MAALESGEVRAAEPGPDGWTVNTWVKKGILLGFRLGHLVETAPAGPLRFFDNDTFLPRQLSLADGVRLDSRRLGDPVRRPRRAGRGGGAPGLRERRRLRRRGVDGRLPRPGGIVRAGRAAACTCPRAR